MRRFIALLLFAIAATAARIGGVWFTDPSPSEAYYFLCGENPAPAYFDGPSGTATLTRFANLEASSDIIWRLAAPIWSFCATLACFALVRSLAGTDRALGVALLLNVLPAFNSAALRAGPALPALTFALVGMLAGWRASKTSRGRLLWWAATALLLGAAAWFAYSAAVIVVGLSCFALHQAGRRQTVSDFLAVLLLLGVPALCLTPALHWNSEQDWIPIAGGTLRTIWAFDAPSFLQSLSGMLLSFSPLLLFAVPVGLVPAWRDLRKGNAEARFVFWCGLPGVLVGSYFVLRGGEGALYFLLVAPLLLWKAMDLCASRPRLAAGLRWAAVILAGIFSAYAIFEALKEGRGWRLAASELGGVFLERFSEGQNDLFLIAENAKLASALGYYLRNDFVAPAGHPTVYVRESQDISNQFAFWPSYADFTETGKVSDEYFTEQQAENAFLGRSALYITHERRDDLPQAITAAFDSVSLFRELPGAGDDSRPLYIYLCLIYQTLPL